MGGDPKGGRVCWPASSGTGLGFPEFWNEYIPISNMAEGTPNYETYKAYTGVTYEYRTALADADEWHGPCVFIKPKEFIDFSDPKFKLRVYWSADTGSGSNVTWNLQSRILKKTQYLGPTTVAWPAAVTWTEPILSTRISGIITGDVDPYLKSKAFTPAVAGGDTFGKGHWLNFRLRAQAPSVDVWIFGIEIQYKVADSMAAVTEWPV